jgi:uncharacterized protein HemX
VVVIAKFITSKSGASISSTTAAVMITMILLCNWVYCRQQRADGMGATSRADHQQRGHRLKMTSSEIKINIDIETAQEADIQTLACTTHRALNDV